MMSNANESAFPEIVTRHEYDTRADKNYPNVHSKGGITKREYFAAIAMQGLIIADPECNLGMDRVSQHAYDQADEMLKEQN